MAIIDQVFSQSTPDEAPPVSRATLSTPRRYVFEKRDSLDNVLGIVTSAESEGGVPTITSSLSEQFRAATPSDEVGSRQTRARAPRASRTPLSPCARAPSSGIVPVCVTHKARVRARVDVRVGRGRARLRLRLLPALELVPVELLVPENGAPLALATAYKIGS
jgi:hypothetical protein